MKALSVRQPYAALIAAGVKEIEYRSWSTTYRGDILIHASKTMPKKLTPYFLKGQAVCIVELYKIEKICDRDFEWHLRNVRFVEPVAIVGKVGLFNVADQDIKPISCTTFDDADRYWVDNNHIASEIEDVSLDEQLDAFIADALEFE